MKKLKAICCIVCTISTICLITVPFMFEAGTIKEFRTSMVLLTIFFFLAITTRLGHWILTDHEENVDFMDYCKENAPEDGNPVRRRYKKSI